MAPVLGYWDSRGLAEPIRCLLHYTDTEFEDKRYSPEFKGSEWFEVKPNLGLEFPDLPYYIDGDFKLTQSLAILRHLGRKHGLALDNTEEELCRAEMVEQQCVDFLWGMVRAVFNEQFATEKAAYIKSLPDKLTTLSKFLGTNSWILGEKLTYVDFYFHEALDHHKYLAPDFLESFNNLKEYIKRFESLHNVQKYLKSDKFKSRPLYSQYSKFGFYNEPF